LEIRECNRSLWTKFRKYHYLNTTLATATKSYIAIINNEKIGFISIIKFVHPKVKNMYRVHRLVILPDYQGIGIGNKLLNFIAEKYYNEKFRFSIVTSTPALIFSLNKNNKWKCKRIGRSGKGSKKGTIHNKNKDHAGSYKRITASFEYDPN